MKILDVLILLKAFDKVFAIKVCTKHDDDENNAKRKTPLYIYD